jgi:hypothetical protein
MKKACEEVIEAEDYCSSGVEHSSTDLLGSFPVPPLLE